MPGVSRCRRAKPWSGGDLQLGPGLLEAGLPGRVRGAVDPQRGGRAETGQGAAPEPLGLSQVLAREPVEERAVGQGRRQIRLLVARQGRVGAEDLLDDHRQRPAVQEQVVVGPEETPGALLHVQEGEAHQRRPRQIEPLLLLLLDEGLEAGLPLRRGELPPVPPPASAGGRDGRPPAPAGRASPRGRPYAGPDGAGITRSQAPWKASRSRSPRSVQLNCSMYCPERGE